MATETHPDLQLPSVCASTWSLGDRLLSIFSFLLNEYGPQHWWPGRGGFETVAGAILTQNTAWTNVEIALARLRERDLLNDPESVLVLSEQELAALIRSSGFHNAKARKLQEFCRMLVTEFGSELDRLFTLPLDTLRLRLLATYGIGPETADAIVLYAAGKPSFVIDAYTRRIFTRLGVTPISDHYEDWRRLFMNALPADAGLYNEYHALIDNHAKLVCRARPNCGRCVLRPSCATGSRPNDDGATEAAGSNRPAENGEWRAD